MPPHFLAFGRSMQNRVVFVTLFSLCRINYLNLVEPLGPKASVQLFNGSGVWRRHFSIREQVEICENKKGLGKV